MRQYIIPLMLVAQAMSHSAYSQSPMYDWAFNVENQNAPTGYIGNGRDIALFGEYVYVTGTFAGTADFDPSAGVSELTSFGEFDIFIQKIDTNGNFIWARQFGGPDADGMTISGAPFNGVPEPLGLSLNVTDEGHLILAATFTDSIDCDPEPNNSFWLISPRGCCAIKISDDGEMIWGKMTSSAGNVYSSDLDGSGNIYLAGYFGWSPVDFDPSPLSELYLETDDFDIFVQKLTPEGELDWVIQFPVSAVDYGVFVEADPDRNIVVVGSFSDSVDFDPGPDEHILAGESPNGNPIFICKLSETGTFIWAGVIETNGGEGHDRLAIDGSGNIYLTQGFFQSVDVDPSEDTLLVTGTSFFSTFISKIESDGSLAWVKVVTGADGNCSNAQSPTTIIVKDQAVYVGGVFNGTAIFDPDSPSVIHTGEGDGFVLKLDTSGSFNWVRTFSGEYHLDLRALKPTETSIYCSGYSVGGLFDCDPGSSVVPLGSDMFLFKWTDSFLVGMPDSPFANQASSIYVYPNPTTDVVYIQQSDPGEFEARVYTALGRLCHTQSFESNEQSSLKLDDSPGIYQVILYFSDKTESFKVIKQ